MKYQNEYLSTDNKDNFISLVLKNNPEIKETTAKRRFYDLRKKFGKQGGRFAPDEKKEPRHIKMLQFNDMKKYGIKIDKEYLYKHGFDTYEVNWLVDQNLI